MPAEILDGVYDITCTDRLSRLRVHLFVDGTPTLVDTGLADTTAALVEGIEEVGVEPERLVLTHGDGDHSGGFDAVVEEYDPETWVPAETALETENDPDHRFGDGTSIGRFVAVHTPGHRDDTYVLVDEDAGVVVMGDTVGGADRRGLPPGYFTLPPNSEDLGLAEESLERLLDYDFDVGLVSHGTSVTEDARGKIDRYVNYQ